jgi:hypothetical protein
MTNKMKSIEKDYDLMKDKVDKLLGQIDKLVSDFDDKYDVNVSNDLHYTLDSIADLIEDNYVDTDFGD